MIRRKHAIKTALTLGALVCLSQSLMIQQCCAAGGGNPQASAETSLKDIGLLEDRFFSRQYANDPPDKRLERLELLVFGGTQDGDNVERLARLRKSVAQRAQAAPEKTAADLPKASPGGTVKAPDSSGQYPVLNTLEWRLLKKTFATESLDDRLARMEKKLFGSDSPGMAYVDRVDRLKRTLGVGVVAAQPTGPMGPGPKARPHGQSMDGWGFNFPPSIMGRSLPQDDMGDEDGDNDMGMGGMPGMPGFNFSFGNSPGLANMMRDMNRQMRAMDKQMRSLQNMPSGSYTFDPQTGAWINRDTGKKMKPATPGQAKPATPQMPHPLPFKFPNRDESVPPYADPNSI